eukprot:9468092-Pyramimonas_sp.AAC.1
MDSNTSNPVYGVKRTHRISRPQARFSLPALPGVSCAGGERVLAAGATTPAGAHACGFKRQRPPTLLTAWTAGGTLGFALVFAFVFARCTLAPVTSCCALYQLRQRSRYHQLREKRRSTHARKVRLWRNWCSVGHDTDTVQLTVKPFLRHLIT